MVTGRLFRAINEKELQELLALNGLKSKQELQKSRKYIFLIHEETSWVNRIGFSTWNPESIAKNQRGYCGVVLKTRVWFTSIFGEKPNEPGRYYCKKTHRREVKIDFIV